MALFFRLVVTLALASPLIACDDPCTTLEQKVCQAKTSRLRKQYAKDCKLMHDKDRRDNLPSRTCESILNHLSKR